jgi:hypothetical protein
MFKYLKNLINSYKQNKEIKLLEHRKLQQEELEYQELLNTKKQVEDYIYFNGVNFTRDFEFLINIIEYYISMHIEVNALILGTINIITSDEEFKLSVAEYSLKIFNRLSIFQKELLYKYLKDEDELLDFIISRIYKVIGTYEIIKNNTLTKK